MQSASLMALLQAALSLLVLVQGTSNIPQSLQTTAIQTAEQALSLAASQFSSEQAGIIDEPVATQLATPTVSSLLPIPQSNNPIVTINLNSLMATSSSFWAYGQVNPGTATLQMLLVPVDRGTSDLRTSVIEQLQQCGCGGLAETLQIPPNGWEAYFHNVASGEYSIYGYGPESNFPLVSQRVTVNY
jgi:hypothetical protein